MFIFKKIEITDIPLIISWLKKPHVKEYWDADKEYSDEYLVNKYTNRILEDEIDMFIVSVNGINIAYIQSYYLDREDYDTYKVNNVSRGIDLFIGDSNYINKGYGTKLLSQFISNYVFSDSSCNVACIDPESANKRAVRTYEKIGFKHVQTLMDKHSKLLTCYMKLGRKEFLENHE